MSNPSSSAADLRDFLVARVAELAHVSQVDTDRPLAEYGLGSRAAVALVGELQDRVDHPLAPTMVWEHPTIDALVEALTTAGRDSGRPAVAGGGGGSGADGTAGDDVAVVGLGCRLPGGVASPADYWRLLMDEVDAVGEVPDGRWEGHHDLTGSVRRGGFLDRVADFDAEFFRISPHEAESMDPQQRLLLEVAWEACEHAGLAPARLRGSRTGVYVGVSGTEYAHRTAADLGRIEGWTATGAAASIAANRISYALDLAGPSMTVDTACSSSLTAVHLALRALRAGEIDTALVGGVNALLTPAVTVAFERAGGTSPHGRCRPFDAAADGMVRAEGCGLVVLRRLADARRDGDRIWALVRGSAVNSDGRSNGLTAPSAAAQEAVLRAACADADVDPGAVDYVEAHGTGTPLGDPVEAGALGRVHGRARPADRPLLVGSVKGNLGHLEAAAGIAGLIKAVLALAHRTIPASLHFTRSNPHIDLDSAHVRVAARTTPWTDTGRPGLSGVSSFGFGGTNAHVVLEEAPPSPLRPPALADPAPVRTLLISDTGRDRVRAQAEQLGALLDGAGGGIDADDLAHTLARRFGRGPVHAAVTARGPGDLRRGLRAIAEDTITEHTAWGSADRRPAGPVWVFSGHGSQWTGMGRRLLAEEPAFLDAVAELDPLLRDHGAPSPLEVLEAGAEPSGVAEVQPLLFTVQVALARLWRDHGVEPGAVIGHSMGEVAAAVVSGALPVQDGAAVICHRSRLLGRLAGRGAMAVLGVSAHEARAWRDRYPDVHVAVVAAPRQTVVTGDGAQVRALAEELSARGVRARALAAGGAGHSPQVEPLLVELTDLLASVRGADPVVPFYSTVLDDPRAAPAFDTGYWAAGTRRPVRLADAVAAAAEDGHRVFTEVSPHPVLGPALADTLDEAGTGTAVVTGTLRRDTDDTLAFRRNLAVLLTHGVPADLSRVCPPGRVLDLPPPPWRHRTYWWTPAPSRGPDGAHPLLGEYAEVPGARRHLWRTVVPEEATEPDALGLTGRTCHGVPVFTLAAAAEAALAAGARVFGRPERDLTLFDVRLEGVRPWGAGLAVTTGLTLLSPVRGRVEVHSRRSGGTFERWAVAEVAVDSAPVVEERTGGAVDTVPGARVSRDQADRAVLDACLAAPPRTGADDAPAPAEGGFPVRAAALRVTGPLSGGGTRTAHGRVSTADGAHVGQIRLTGADGSPLLEARGIDAVDVRAEDVPVPLDDKVFRLVWEKAPPPTPAPADTSDTDGWVVVGAEDDPAPSGFAAHLAGTGHAVSAARHTTPAGLPAALADALRRAERSTTGAVVFLAPADDGDSMDADPARLVRAVVAAVHTLLDTRAERLPRLWLVTRGALPVREGEGGDPRTGWARGLVRTLAVEHPELRATLVDLDADLSADPLCRDLCRETTSGTRDDEVAWREGTRHAARLVRARPRPPGGLVPAQDTVRRGAAYAVTGGLDGLGLATAGGLAERGAGRLVLHGPRDPDPSAEKAIAGLREEGVEVEVVVGDLAEPGTAEAVVAAAHGRLLGVVHAAGDRHDRSPVRLDPTDLDRVWRPAAVGGLRLHEATRHLDLDWWVAYSSVDGLLGVPGGAAEAAAGAWLDALAAARRAEGLPGMSVSWGPWAQAGRAPYGLLPDGLTTDEALEAFDALLAARWTAAGVLRLRPESAADARPALRATPFFSELLSGSARAPATTTDVAALREADPGTARARLTDRVRDRIAGVLGRPSGQVDPATPLTDLGFDSLLAVRLRAVVEHDLGITLPASLLLAGTTTVDVADTAACLLDLSPVPETPPAPVAEEPQGDPDGPAGGRSPVAPRDATERLVARVVRSVLGIGDVGVTDDFHRLGGTTAQAAAVADALAEHSGHRIDAAELFAVATVERAADVLRAREEPAAGALCPVQPRGTRPPLALAHPAGGTTAVYRGLARLLGTDQPVLGLERADDVLGVEERAARYADLLRERRPGGPHLLGGWSYGGVLAFATARLLTRMGERVDLVALIDAGLPLPLPPGTGPDQALADRFSGFADHLRATYGLPVELDRAELDGLGEDAQYALVMDRARDAGLDRVLSPAILRHQRTSHEDTRSLERYRPGPYDGRVVLYRGTEPTPWAVRDPRYDHRGDALGWDAHCADLEIVRVPGHHLSLLDPPGVAVIADHLSAALRPRT